MAFVNPNPMDQSCWIFQMAHLSTWFRRISIDIPGYGRSPKARDGLTMVDMAQACWEAIDDAAPNEPAILVSCSTGSATVPHMHHLRPDKTKALIMCGTAYNPGKEFVVRRVKSYTERGIDYRWDYTFGSSRRSAKLRSRCICRHVRRTQFAGRSRHDHPSVLRPQGSRARRPFLQNHMSVHHLDRKQDGAHQAAFALKDLMPNCEMRILHGAGNACQIKQPLLFDRYMIEFLKSHGLFPASSPTNR